MATTAAHALSDGDLRLRAAFAIKSYIEAALEKYQDRRLVVDDIVNRWHSLPLGMRRRYERPHLKFAPIERFAWDYADRIAERAENPSRTDLPRDFDPAVRVVWREHAARLAARADRGTT